MLNKVSPTPSLLYAENCLPEGPSGCVNLWQMAKRDHPFTTFANFSGFETQRRNVINITRNCTRRFMDYKQFA